MSNPSDDLREALVAAADHSAPCARVLRYYEDRQVSTRPRDFYVALKRVDPLVVRVDAERPGESLLPLDCRFQNGAVEFTHEHRKTGIAGRDEFVGDVKEADSVTLIPHAESQFTAAGDGDECVDADVDDSEVRADGGTAMDEAGGFEICDECGTPVQNLGAHKHAAHEGDAETEQREVPVPELAIESHVLLKSPKMVAGVAHIPADPDGYDPLCSTTPRKDPAWRTNGWYTADPSNLPNHRVCHHCWKLHDEDTSVATDGGPDYPAPEDVGFPVGTLYGLTQTAEERFLEKVADHGPGENWLDDDPGYHLWRATIQLVDALDDEGGVDETSLADALNHMLFAAEIDTESSGDHDADLRTDGGTQTTRTGHHERRTPRQERRDERPPFVDATAENAACYFCGRTWNPPAVDGFDLSEEDEYYPKMVPVCPEHAEGCR